MRRLGIALIAAGSVFLLSGIVAVAWATSRADAMSEEQKALDPGQYDFYVSAQSCSLGSVILGLVIIVIGFLAWRQSATAAKRGQAMEVKVGS